jgi:antitoxin VapB
MNAPRATKSFKSGNSVAVRMPAALGIRPGEDFTVREEGGRYILERQPRRIDWDRIIGSAPNMKPLTREEREFEERPLDWEGKLLRRG